MHSRIFQMETKPIDDDDYITEDTIIDNTNFLETVGDYVVESENRTDDISWLLRYLSESDKVVFNKLEDSILFKKGFKLEYFEKAFKAFVKAANEITLEEFSGHYSTKIFDIEYAINNKFGFYIYSEDGGCITFDDFVRDMKEEVPYYIGATFDYHS